MIQKIETNVDVGAAMFVVRSNLFTPHQRCECADGNKSVLFATFFVTEMIYFFVLFGYCSHYISNFTIAQ